MPVPMTTLWRRLILDPAGTRASFKVPALVWEAPPASSPGAPSWELTRGGTAPHRPSVGESLVFPLEKAAQRSNAFPMGITIGRIDTNDLILDDPSISRFHAWVQLDERTHQWTITDAESHNGTWIDGQRAQANQRVPLVDQVEVRLGDAKLKFYLPASLLTVASTFGDGPPVP